MTYGGEFTDGEREPDQGASRAGSSGHFGGSTKAIKGRCTESVSAI